MHVKLCVRVGRLVEEVAGNIHCAAHYHNLRRQRWLSERPSTTLARARVCPHGPGKRASVTRLQNEAGTPNAGSNILAKVVSEPVDRNEKVPLVPFSCAYSAGMLLLSSSGDVIGS